MFIKNVVYIQTKNEKKSSTRFVLQLIYFISSQWFDRERERERETMCDGKYISEHKIENKNGEKQNLLNSETEKWTI